jgi:hypothetical protein
MSDPVFLYSPPRGKINLRLVFARYRAPKAARYGANMPRPRRSPDCPLGTLPLGWSVVALPDPVPHGSLWRLTGPGGLSTTIGPFSGIRSAEVGARRAIKRLAMWGRLRKPSPTP